MASDEVVWEGEFKIGHSPRAQRFRVVRRGFLDVAIQDELREDELEEDDDPWADLGTTDDHLGDARRSLRTAACVAEKIAADLDAARELLREVRASGVEFNDERVGYLAVQIDRETWQDIAAFLERKP